MTGRPVDEDDTSAALITNPFTGDRTEIPQATKERRERSAMAPM